jgi:acetyl-CoA C-acetyltransferase
MDKPIYLIGMGQTRFGEHWDTSLRTLIDEAVSAALLSSRLTPLDIDCVVVANMLGERGSDQAHLGALTASLLPHQPPALRVEAACASGSVAIHTAVALLESGRARNILVVGAEKMTDASTEDIASALMTAGDSERDRPSGLTFPGIFGLVATRYMHEHGLTREQLNIVSAFHHRNAAANPYAQFRNDVTPEAVGKSALVADPLRLLDCSPITDGAAACILSTVRKSNLRLAASQIATDSVSIAERETLTSFRATKDAADHALQEAETSLEDISALELHDCFSIAALVHLEDLGFAEPGESIHMYEEHYREEPRTNLTSLNRSGGLKACGHPVGATGIKQLIDVGKRLAEANARFGMTHNIGGAAATCGIHILEHIDA